MSQSGEKGQQQSERERAGSSALHSIPPEPSESCLARYTRQADTGGGQRVYRGQDGLRELRWPRWGEWGTIL